MTEQDFDTLADLIGPRPGAVREALRGYYVGGKAQIAAAADAGIARGSLSKYVGQWEEKLPRLCGVDWAAVQVLCAGSKRRGAS